MVVRYTFQNQQKFEEGKMARAYGQALPISTKFAIEVCRAIKNKKIDSALRILDDAIKLKRAIPFKKVKEGAGHKPAMERGKFVIKTCKYIKDIVESAKSNALNKGLFQESLYIVHACANKAHEPPKPGRHRGRVAKRTHIEIVLTELEEKKENTTKGSDKGESKAEKKKSNIQEIEDEKKEDDERKDKEKKKEPIIKKEERKQEEITKEIKEENGSLTKEKEQKKQDIEQSNTQKTIKGKY